MNISSLRGGVLLGLLLTVQALAETSPETALNSLHTAGADKNQAEFIELLTPDAVFLGVGGESRLQGQSLRDFINTSFGSGNLWNYRIGERDVQLSPDGSVAWFDESLQHEQLGDGRASGVLVKNGSVWKIVQYNLTLPLVRSPLVPEAGTPGASAPANQEAPQEPECRKTRHKTNKRASC
jgi:hypothetical protein